jgi:glycosyltransferase involved in cell wall biosynthesis
MTPPLSVVMPVHNALPYLDDSVGSILGQTFSDFEFVILDDGSTDGSLEQLRGWAAKDARIRLIEGGTRSGPVESSNRVVAESRAPLVARMDADDVARPPRLERQMEALKANPDAALVGGVHDTIDQDGRQVRGVDYARLVRRSHFPPFGHSSIMFRRRAFEAVGGYRREAVRWEDIDLYRRLAERGRILVLTEPLLSVRVSEASTRLTADRSELEEAMDRMYRALGGAPNARGRILPQAFMASAASRVWNGRRPHVLGRLLRRGQLSLDTESATMLVWAAWADLSPRTLRIVLRGLLRLRNSIAAPRLAGRGLVEWRPPAASSIETSQEAAANVAGWRGK